MKFIANISVTNEGNSFLSCDRSVSIGMRKLHIFNFDTIFVLTDKFRKIFF